MSSESSEKERSSSGGDTSEKRKSLLRLSLKPQRKSATPSQISPQSSSVSPASGIQSTPSPSSNRLSVEKNSSVDLEVLGTKVSDAVLNGPDSHVLMFELLRLNSNKADIFRPIMLLLNERGLLVQFCEYCIAEEVNIFLFCDALSSLTFACIIQDSPVWARNYALSGELLFCVADESDIQ